MKNGEILRDAKSNAEQPLRANRKGDQGKENAISVRSEYMCGRVSSVEWIQLR